ncbi:MAG TPA: hypothetical protein VF701_01720 [Thermoanaerobaculia bacterium]
MPGNSGDRALNLAAPDQTLPEILLLSGSLPPSTSTVVVFITPEEAGSDLPLPRLAANAAWMFGLRPSPRAIDSVTKCTGAAPFRPRINEAIEARWVLRQALDTRLRDMIRPSLQIQRQRESLEFPSLYQFPLASPRLEADLVRIRNLEIRPLHPTRGCILSTLHHELTARNARLVLVIPPIHPAAIPRGYDAFTTTVNAFSRASSIDLLDLTNALPSRAFADARHLTWDGAEAFTSLLRQQMDGESGGGTD